MEDKIIDTKTKWDILSNNKIKENLMVLQHEHISLKNEIDKLLEKLDEVEKEYYYGNSVLIKRYKLISPLCV